MTAHASACFPATLHHHILPTRRNIPSAALPARRLRAVLPPVMASASDASPDLLEAAKHTVNNYVKSGMVVGLGCGRASALAIQHLGRCLRDRSLENIVGIPMSVSSASEAAKAGIPLDDYQDGLQVDFTFLDADIIEEETLAMVIGRRKLEDGDSVIEEKSIVKAAGSLAFIVPEQQYTKQLDGSIPVLINTGNWLETAEEIDDMFLGDAEVWRRSTIGHADPLGGNFPLITKEGHYILDVIFTSPILNLAQVAESLDQIDGVVDHGVISGIPCIAIIASKSGLVTVDNLAKLGT